MEDKGASGTIKECYLDREKQELVEYLASKVYCEQETLEKIADAILVKYELFLVKDRPRE